MQAIRISVMQKYNNNAEDINNNHDYYYMLKKFKYFFLSEFDDLSNGSAEGINSKLEIININGYGFSNFNRYKNKCIYSINKDVAIKN